MVHGPGISELEPSIEYPGVSISRVEHTDNPNYLFVYLDISEAARAGFFDIRFSNGTATISYPYSLLVK